MSGGSTGRDSRHAYPKDVARLLISRWEELGSHPEKEVEALPPADVLEDILTVCYQASLMREEDRPVTLRLLLCNPERLPAGKGPPAGLSALRFHQPRTFEPHELRRLSPAAGFHRSFVGARLDGEKRPEIWGIVHSGTRWVKSARGGRESPPPLPPALVIQVTGPGRMEFSLGSETIARLEEGSLVEPSLDVYESGWLAEYFAPVAEEVMALHEEDREKATEPWARLDPNIAKDVVHQMLRRLVATVRGSRHGATLVIVPTERVREGLLSIKYGFSGEEPSGRFREMMVAIMNTLAELFVLNVRAARAVGWREYRASRHHRVSDLDEAVFEVSHLIAELCAVDGAVVLSGRFEIVGFGAEISGGSGDARTVHRALDVEGEKTAEESVEGVGTRHRSAYRLCENVPEALVIVVSQDGDARFVRRHDNRVTYWDQA